MIDKNSSLLSRIFTWVGKLISFLLGLFIIVSVIKLIDFGWATESEHEMEDIPMNLGTKFKSGSGFDDEYSLRKSIEWILTKQR